MSSLERAIADACLGERAGDAIASDLRGFLEARGVAPEDVAAVLEAPHRLAVYRSLVRNGLSAIVLRMLARTRARMNATCGGRFDADLARFVDEVGPRTHYLRDVPAELLAWAAPRWRGDPSVPAYLPDLAAHELASFTVAASEAASASAKPVEVAIDRGLLFAASVRVLRHAWAVHELAADEEGTREPLQRDVCLLAYRDAGHVVRWIELTPLAASIVERLMDGDALGVAVERACAHHGTAAAHVIDPVSRLLEDLGARGVLLGGSLGVSSE